MRGESGGVLDPVETLLLRRGDELTVHDDRRAGVAVVSVETENYHKCISDFEFRIADLQ